MRLSEAIRLGSMMKPQAFGVVYGPDNQSTCALGAAIDAIGCPWTVFHEGCEVSTGRSRGPAKAGAIGILSPREWWPFLQALHQCPACKERAEWLYGMEVIAHLNDWHEWTRERIADFVEAEELMLERRAREAVTEGIEYESARMDVHR